MPQAQAVAIPASPPLSPEQKRLVRESFARLAPNAEEVASRFYARLFELDPSLRSLFRGDLKEQGGKLMDMIAVAVGSLDRMDSILPSLKLLGAAHRSAGVRDADYDTMGAAFLWTLAASLNDGFTPAAKDAWVVVYGLVASAMKNRA